MAQLGVEKVHAGGWLSSLAGICLGMLHCSFMLLKHNCDKHKI